MKNTIRILNEIMDGSHPIELSHVLAENMPSWPTLSKYFHTLWCSYDMGDESKVYQMLMNEHHGTHIDMPCHYIKGGRNAAEIDARQFYGLCITIDFSFAQNGEKITAGQIKKWEKQNEAIQENDIVLIYFGWSKYWALKPSESYNRFMNEWPGLNPCAAEYLRDKKIRMIGVDTMSIDVINDVGSPAHGILLGAGIPIVENLNNLDKMARRGFFIALPLLIDGGSASPVRAIGFSG